MRARYFVLTAMLAIALGATSVCRADEPQNQKRTAIVHQTPMGIAFVINDPALHESRRLANAADRAAAEGNYAEAEAMARKALARWSGNLDAQRVLAENLLAQGRSEEALAAYADLVYGKGTEIRYHEAIGLLPYALLLSRAGQWAHAASIFNTAVAPMRFGSQANLNVQFDPAVPRPVALEAAAHIGIGLEGGLLRDHLRYPDPNNVLIEYERALKLMPDWDVAVFYVGDGLHQAGRHAEAKPYIERAAKIGSADVRRACRDLYGPRSSITFGPGPDKAMTQALLTAYGIHPAQAIPPGQAAPPSQAGSADVGKSK